MRMSTSCFVFYTFDNQDVMRIREAVIVNVSEVYAQVSTENLAVVESSHVEHHVRFNGLTFFTDFNKLKLVDGFVSVGKELLAVHMTFTAEMHHDLVHTSAGS